jgi:hypothetical protein
MQRSIYKSGLCSDGYRVSHLVLHGRVNSPAATGGEEGEEEEAEEEVFHGNITCF